MNCNMLSMPTARRLRILTYRIPINMLVFATLISVSVVGGTKPEESKCDCSEDIATIFENIHHLKLEVDVNTDTLKNWVPLYSFVVELRKKLMEEDIEKMVKRVIEKNYPAAPSLPVPESLIMRREDGMLNDSAMTPKPDGEAHELAKNVSSLLAKVEKVENRTMEVEEELKSERRVRRHLEQEVKETQSTLIFLEDQLHNVSVPVDAVMSHVQMVLYSSLEDMNRTFYEDYLQKLHYKVDGVVYMNETRKLDERIDHVEAEIHETLNSSVVIKLAEEVKNLEETLQIINSSIGEEIVPRMIMLESETVRKDAVEELENKMIDLLNNTVNFKRELSSVWTDIKDFQDFQEGFKNFSMEWSKSLKDLQTQIEVLTNESSDTIVSSYVSQTVEDPYDMDDVVLIDRVVQTKNETELEDDSILHIKDDNVTATVLSNFEDDEVSSTSDNDDTVTPAIANRLRVGGSPDIYIDTCDIPVTNDPHLLIDIETDPDGRQKLIFGCRPIGEYVVNNPPVPVRCEGGSWSGPLPTCHKLLDANSIEIFSIQLKKENPCIADSGEYPDPTNCSRYIMCDHGRANLMSCPPDLHFNKKLKVCDYPIAAACEEDNSTLIQQFQELIPPITIEPNTLDKPSGLLGTGPGGQLIVHPRSSFTLHCLYPESIWGRPHWDITYSSPGDVTRILDPKNGKNKVSLTVTVAKEEDSGLYRCLTPFGTSHGIYVLVKAVQCPNIKLENKYEEVYYRPTPEGEIRIMGTRAEFPCVEGHVFATCMANGEWSRGVPEETECILRRRCEPIDTTYNQDLILEEAFSDKIVYFKCARGKLIGDGFTRCLDDGTWSHMYLPRCVV